MVSFRKFVREEDGIVTLEWVAIAAGAMILALGIITVLEPALGQAALDLANLIGNL